MANLNLEWKNDNIPALNEENLNALTNQVIANSSDIEDINTILDGGVTDLVDSFDTESSAGGELVVEGKINIADLISLLSNVGRFDSTSVFYGGNELATRNWVSENFAPSGFNSYSTSASLSDIKTNELQVHFAVDNSVAITDLTIEYGTGGASIIIGSLGGSGDVLFFDQDLVDYIDVKLSRMVNTADNEGYVLLTIADYMAGGYNRREISEIVPCGMITGFVPEFNAGVTVNSQKYLWCEIENATEYTVFESVNDVPLDD